jgi:hypothetical protein
VSAWPGYLFHDAQLSVVEIDWSAGTACHHFVPNQAFPDQPRILDAHGLRHAEFPRRHDWGPIACVLETSGPELASDDESRLVITMQSGDSIVLVATEFVPER